MEPESMTTVIVVAGAAVGIVAFWRKVLLVLSAVAVAVFLYGLVYLAALLRV